MLKHLQPDLGAVVWDRGLPQRRTALQPDYKVTRKEMPAPMVPQLEAIEELTPWLGFQNISLADTEADDLMGCYTLKAQERGIEVILATNDKDLFQLVDGNVKIYSTAKADLASPKDAFALLGAEAVTAKWDVLPALIGDVLAISGDAVDNIPGVGVGRKAAAKLLREFGSLRALLEGVDRISTAKTRDKIATGKEQIIQNRKMIQLDCDLELPVPIDGLRITPDYPRLIEALEHYEFKSLLQEVREEASRVAVPVQGELL
jgi:DNA polymerase-1